MIKISFKFVTDLKMKISEIWYWSLNFSSYWQIGQILNKTSKQKLFFFQDWKDNLALRILHIFWCWKSHHILIWPIFSSKFRIFSEFLIWSILYPCSKLRYKWVLLDTVLIFRFRSVESFHIIIVNSDKLNFDHVISNWEGAGKSESQFFCFLVERGCGW